MKSRHHHRWSTLPLAAALALWCSASATAQTSTAPAPLGQSPVRAPAPLGALEPAPQAWVAQPSDAQTAPQLAGPARLLREKSGSFPLKAIARVRLDIDLGNVFVRTDAHGEFRYRLELESDQSGPVAESQLDGYRVRVTEKLKALLVSGRSSAEGGSPSRVSYELSVPRDVRVEVSTAAGNIQMQDSESSVSLETGGGNITIGSAGSARLVTQGGHIVAGNVSGDLHAQTGGGHITAANVGGDAVLMTTGGHIHAGKIGGTAQLETGGGNITVDRAASHVTASSAGGQISFGEASGAINAHTAGGGIHVLRVAGPMQLDSNGGSILLTQVAHQVHALSDTGSITAWFAPGGKLTNPSDLAAKQGDIVIYLPRSLAVTIDATVESPDHRILADPALPVKINYVESAAGRTAHGQCALNGGGEVLHLRTVDGNIQLRVADTLARQQRLLIDQQLLQWKQVEEQFSEILQSSQLASDQARQQFQQIVNELEQQQAEVAREVASDLAIGATAPLPATAPRRSPGLPPAPPTPPPAGWAKTPPAAAQPPPAMAFLWKKLDVLWWGGVRVEAAEQQRRVVYGVQPEYPDAARQAGIQGPVELRVLIDRDGNVQDVRAISGEQVLVNSATEAVRKWRYRPFLLNDEPAPVITTVRLEFRIF